MVTPMVTPMVTYIMEINTLVNRVMGMASLLRMEKLGTGLFQSLRKLPEN